MTYQFLQSKCEGVCGLGMRDSFSIWSVLVCSLVPSPAFPHCIYCACCLELQVKLKKISSGNSSPQSASEAISDHRMSKHFLGEHAHCVLTHTVIVPPPQLSNVFHLFHRLWTSIEFANREMKYVVDEPQRTKLRGPNTKLSRKL